MVDVEKGYQPPSARSFHAAVADEQAGRLYVLGGYNGEVCSLGGFPVVGACVRGS